MLELNLCCFFIFFVALLEALGSSWRFDGRDDHLEKEGSRHLLKPRFIYFILVLITSSLLVPLAHPVEYWTSHKTTRFLTFESCGYHNPEIQSPWSCQTGKNMRLHLSITKKCLWATVDIALLG